MKNSRPKGAPTPCESCPKIPNGVYPKPENAEELTEQNFRAFLHYQECRAVNHWPDDPIVRRNARLIRQVYDRWDREPFAQILGVLSRG